MKSEIVIWKKKTRSFLYFYFLLSLFRFGKLVALNRFRAYAETLNH